MKNKIKTGTETTNAKPKKNTVNIKILENNKVEINFDLDINIAGIEMKETGSLKFNLIEYLTLSKRLAEADTAVDMIKILGVNSKELLNALGI